ncbi:MAG TPA: hypothetical protein VFU47_08335, partial [Armatimonadota bacterium]|nr:hypothetical protein [Armatimonadota bacterium]
LKPEAARQKVDRLVECLRESSRFHGYEDPQAPPFLEYQVEKLVDLTDADPKQSGPDGNSSRYPRVPDWKEGINFQYSQLFTPKFAAYYGYADPARPGRFLSLKELVDQGTIHEVWFLALQGKFGAPLESVEVKQAYDERFRKRAGVSVQAGNGGDPGQPFLGRSLKILFINAERGPGCAMESLGHSMEGMAHSGAVPYFTRYFHEFGGFDLDRRFGLPFKSLYEAPKPVSYPDPHTLVYPGKDGKPVEVRNFYVIGGTVHFTPTGRQDYDLNNPQSVMCTIEDYRMGSGPGGKDRAKEWNDQVFKRYNQLANDCMGPWLVYWRQNMPGYRSRARDDQGRPMKSWWPFLFY